MIQWLRLQAPNAGDLDLIPCQGTRSHKPQLRVQVLQLRLSEIKLKKKERYFSVVQYPILGHTLHLVGMPLSLPSFGRVPQSVFFYRYVFIKP